MFEALFLLFIKHFICDFPLQANPWIYRNKGTYMHPGGITHAGIHAIGTLLVLAPYIGSACLLYAAIDMVLHYHIDWAKMNVSKHYDLQPNNSDRFWILLGFDQLLHHITYFAIVYFAFNLSL
ncbi:MAG TPA: DUF3307 domain-containing protein [Methylotenera sp.]|nr:DUF3307 domain-containing protein [Methylotenera sp.]HPV43974.1 DUF3307 domain-containing protein [Methylotenera sp.]